MKIAKRILFAVVVTWILVPSVSAQEPAIDRAIEMMDRIEVRPNIGVLIDDRGMLESRTSGRSVSMTTSNGVTTIKVIEPDKKVEINDDSNGQITCRVTKMYGPDDAAEIEKSHPELFMHLMSIPETIGNSKVEITVGVTTEYVADNADDLKEKHPDVFKIYDQYRNGPVRIREWDVAPRAIRGIRFGADGVIELDKAEDRDSESDEDSESQLEEDSDSASDDDA